MTDEIAVRIAALEQQLAALKTQQAIVSLGEQNDQRGANITFAGDIAGGDIIKIVMGRDPDEDEQRALSGYLWALRERLRPLVLRGLAERLDERGQRPAMPHVYTTLATMSLEEVVSGSFAQLEHFFENVDEGKLNEQYNPDHALPDAAVVRVVTIAPKGSDRIERRRLLRSRLASEAAGRQRRLVLLGNPGSGKTTFLHHLAWALASRTLGDTATLAGWDTAERRRLPRTDPPRPAYMLPVIVSLRRLAQRLVDAPDVAAVVRTEALYGLTQGGRSPILMDRLLGTMLDTGAVLLLCDGLDEVPIADKSCAGRADVLHALREFDAAYPHARLLVTCRTRAFAEDLREVLNWPVEELAPLTLGQMRHLVRALYGELAACVLISPEQQGRLGDELLAAITDSSRLRDMAETPLLLTLMALVLVNQGALPHDRPLLYERVLDLLLGQWDKLRDGETLAQAIGQPDWDADRLAPLLNQLSYDAHRDTSITGERGGIARMALYEALGGFFSQSKINAPMAAAERCLDYFEQRSGLLVPDESDSYTFVHLTLQEHCAGRYLMSRPKPVDEIMKHRAEDRWREPIFLGLGLTQRQTPFTIIEVLRRLIDRKEQRKAKDAPRWQRDLIFAAELAEDRRWERLAEAGAEIEDLQDSLRNGLVELLDDQSGTLPLEERIRAGYALGRLGDPRLDPRRADYWCRIPAGWVEVDGEQIWVEEFEIAKYPVTLGEFNRFIKETVTHLSSVDEFLKSLPQHLSITPVGYYLISPQPPTDGYEEWVAKEVDLSIRYPFIHELAQVYRNIPPKFQLVFDTYSHGQLNALPVGTLPASIDGVDLSSTELAEVLSFTVFIPKLRLARDVPKP